MYICSEVFVLISDFFTVCHLVVNFILGCNVTDHKNDKLLMSPDLCPRSVGITADDNKWHQICVTWENSKGEWKSYKDGVFVKSGVDFKKGYTIHAEGSLVLGQEQDDVGGGFDSKQSFVGRLANVNVWSYVLPGSTINELSKCCMIGEGNVYKWYDFLYGIKGNVRLRIPAGCPCTF